MVKHAVSTAAPAITVRSTSDARAAVTPLPAFPARCGWLGTYPAEMAIGALPWLIGAAAAGVALAFACLAVQGLSGRIGAGSVSLVGAGALLALAAALGFLVVAAHGVLHQLFLGACRRRARAGGLAVLLLVPESPALARYLHGLRGLSVPRRAEAYSVHVDPAWRAPREVPAAERRALFGRLYAADYDRVLSALAGRDALVCSSTFNRHESPVTARAAEERWRVDGMGPLFPWQPRRHGPRARAREQRRMFGAVLTGRRVDRPGAWRVRVFDSARAKTVQREETSAC